MMNGARTVSQIVPGGIGRAALRRRAPANGGWSVAERKDLISTP
jgi:hypothetical protein